MTPTCAPQQVHAVDVILVIDRSNSMAGQKLDDAKQAAQTLVGLMDLSRDQVGLVSFAGRATLDQQLTHDQNTLLDAIDTITTTNDTNIFEGVARAERELAGRRHNPDAAPVMIVLSDGRATPGGSSDASSSPPTSGTRIITIGLGDDADAQLLRGLATAPDDYYFAPTSADLATIYRTIVGSIHSCDQ